MKWAAVLRNGGKKTWARHTSGHSSVQSSELKEKNYVKDNIKRVVEFVKQEKERSREGKEL